MEAIKSQGFAIGNNHAIMQTDPSCMGDLNDEDVVSRADEDMQREKANCNAPFVRNKQV